MKIKSQLFALVITTVAISLSVFASSCCKGKSRHGQQSDTPHVIIDSVKPNAIDHQQQERSQKSIKSFFSNNECSGLEISFFLSDVKFYFTPDSSWVETCVTEKHRLSDAEAAKALSLIDSLKFSTSPDYSSLSTEEHTDKGLTNSPTIMTLDFITLNGTYRAMHSYVSYSDHTLHRYNPLMVELSDLLREIAGRGRGEVDDPDLVNASIDNFVLQPWDIAPKSLELNDENRYREPTNHPVTPKRAALKEYFEQKDISQIVIKRFSKNFGFTIIIAPGMSYITHSPQFESTSPRLTIGDKNAMEIVSLLDYLDIEHNSLVQYIIDNSISNNIKTETRDANEGWLNISVYRNGMDTIEFGGFSHHPHLKHARCIITSSKDSSHLPMTWLNNWIRRGNLKRTKSHFTISHLIYNKSHYETKKNR